MKRCKQGASASSSLNECVSHLPSHGSGQMDRRRVLKHGLGQGALLERDMRLHLEHTDPKGPGEVQRLRRGSDPQRGLGRVSSACLGHVVKGARASCGVSAQL